MRFIGSAAAGLAFVAGTALALPTQGNDTTEYPDLVERGGTVTLCTPPHIMPISATGGTGGGPYCVSKWPGPVLPKSFTTYCNKKDINGFVVTFTDGTSERRGTGFNTNHCGTITFAAGELVTYAHTAANGDAKRIGKIRIETDKGQKVDFGNSDRPNTFPAPLGSGLFVGVTGHSGDGIDALGLMFASSKIVGINIGNMKIDPGQLSAAQNGPSTSRFTDQVHYYNDAPTNGSYVFKNSRKVTDTTTITTSLATSIGQTYTFSVELEFPEVAKVSASMATTWQLTRTNTKETSKSEEFLAEYQQSGILMPFAGTDCTAFTYVSEGTFSYTSDVTYTFEDGSKFSYPDKGQLSTTQYTQGISSCKATSSKTPPNGFTNGIVDKA